MLYVQYPVRLIVFFIEGDFMEAITYTMARQNLAKTRISRLLV